MVCNYVQLTSGKVTSPNFYTDSVTVVAYRKAYYSYGGMG